MQIILDLQKTVGGDRNGIIVKLKLALELSHQKARQDFFVLMKHFDGVKKRKLTFE